jgi:hypothetical protein
MDAISQEDHLYSSINSNMNRRRAMFCVNAKAARKKCGGVCPGILSRVIHIKPLRG